MLHKLASCLPFPYMHNPHNSAAAAANPATVNGLGPSLTIDNVLAPPVELAMITGIEQQNSVMIPQILDLPELINTRTDLIVQLKATIGYQSDFDFLIDDMMRFTDEGIDLAKKISYTQRVNTILQAMLLYPTLYTYCMKASGARKKVYFTNQHTQFIHSQAIKSLLFLEDAFNGAYLPETPHYQELIARSEKILAWKGLIKHIHQDEQILHLQQDMHFGAVCQFNVSLLYAVQTQLRLPVIVEPLDPLVDIPQDILAKALTQAQQYKGDSIKLYKALYDLLFWRTYAEGEYKKDPSVRKTLLREACKHIEASAKTSENMENNERMLEARRMAIREIFTEAIISTMRRLTA